MAEGKRKIAERKPSLLKPEKKRKENPRKKKTWMSRAVFL